jgi:transposase
MIGLVVTPASVQDRDAIAPMLRVTKRHFPGLKGALTDCGTQGAATATAVLRAAGLPLEIVKRSDIKGFHIVPRRWIVERTFGWLGRCRRLAKDFETFSAMHAAFVVLAMIRLMLRRIIRLRAVT